MVGQRKTKRDREALRRGSDEKATTEAAGISTLIRVPEGKNEPYRNGIQSVLMRTFAREHP